MKNHNNAPRHCIRLRSVMGVLARLTAVILGGLVVSAVAQVSLVVDDFPAVAYRSPVTHYRPFLGRFEFERPPQPLEPVTVRYRLEPCLDRPVRPGDWNMRISFDPKYLRLEGDSLFMWPGPHVEGNVYEGQFTVTPLTSGLHGFSVYMIFPDNIYAGPNLSLEVLWCIDADGNLSLLGRPPETGTLTCTLQSWSFFTPDSISMREHVLGKNPGQRITWQAVVKPAFRIGDTSIVHYTLTALEDIVEPIGIEIGLEGMQLVKYPEKINPPILAGTVIERELAVVPIAIRELNAVGFTLYCVGPDGLWDGYTAIGCTAVFNDDGSLRLAGNTHPTSSYDGLLPSTFREKTGRDSEWIRLESNVPGVESSRKYGSPDSADVETGNDNPDYLEEQ